MWWSHPPHLILPQRMLYPIPPLFTAVSVAHPVSAYPSPYRTHPYPTAPIQVLERLLLAPLASLTNAFTLPLPVQDYNENQFFVFAAAFIGLVGVYAFLYPVSITIRTIAQEKETRIKQGPLPPPLALPLLSHSRTYPYRYHWCQPVGHA